ncbi:hypothetical protein CHUAL_004734 [Chamberlinius hualienensis]
MEYSQNRRDLSLDNDSPQIDLPDQPSETSSLLLSNGSHVSYSESQNHFGDSRRGVRRPFHYQLRSHHDSLPETNSLAIYNRAKYYNKLCDPNDHTLRIPNHVVPTTFFYGIPQVGPGVVEGKQSSLVTIFVIWNTMLGSSLLSMPWAISQAGFTFGIVIMLIMATICFYTAYRIVGVQKFVGPSENSADFTNICGNLLGPWGSRASIIFSLSSLLGATIVYWILCTNFLFYVVSYIHDSIVGFSSRIPDGNGTHVICVNDPSGISPSHYRPHSHFEEIWNLHKTAPLFLVFLLGPLVNIRSPDFFAKFSAFGTLSVMFLTCFVAIKAWSWGFNLNFTDPNNPSYVPQFRGTFFTLSGTLSLSLFIHNCILSIMRNQKNPKNNARDLGIAYVLVTMTYLFVGLVFYAAFPLAKSCIADNLLNNISGNDLLAFLARVFLFFQMVTVCPLLYYIFRIQFMYYVFGSVYPGFTHILIMNTLIMTVSVLFAIFLPSIGTIIRFSGAFCGVAYIFALPCLTYLAGRKRKGKLSNWNIAFHAFLILIGVTNFIAQFAYL